MTHLAKTTSCAEETWRPGAMSDLKGDHESRYTLMSKELVAMGKNMCVIIQIARFH
jgi:hypothetical protein